MLSLSHIICIKSVNNQPVTVSRIVSISGESYSLMRSSDINQGSFLQAGLFEGSRPKRAMKTPVAVLLPSTYMHGLAQAGTGAMSGFVALP